MRSADRTLFWPVFATDEAGAERCHRRQPERLEFIRSRKKVPVYGEALAQVDDGWSAEGVALVLRQHVGGRPAGGAALHDLEQHRMEVRARQSCCQLVERRRANTIDDPVAVVHEETVPPAVIHLVRRTTQVVIERCPCTTVVFSGSSSSPPSSSVSDMSSASSTR